MFLIAVPSLKHVATVKIVTTFWKHEKIKKLIISFNEKILFDFEMLAEWKIIETEVRNIISNLQYYKPIKEILLSFSKPISQELYDWIKYHGNYIYNSIYFSEVLENIEWGCAGKIDALATVKTLIRNEFFSPSICFNLAAKYCLEEELKTQWNKLQEHEKERLRNIGSENLAKYCFTYVYWVCQMIEKPYILEHFLCDLFLPNRVEVTMCESALYRGNFICFRYFWNKITSKEQQKILNSVNMKSNKVSLYPLQDAPGPVYYVNIFLYLLSEMNFKQRANFLNKNTKYVLCNFLDWPAQDSFIGMAKQMSSFITNEEFSDILMLVVQYMTFKNIEYYDYKHLLGEFWVSASEENKQYILQGHTSNQLPYILSYLLMNNDYKNIELVLESASETERNAILLNDISILEPVIIKSKWKLITFFIKQCITTKQNLIQLKQDFQNESYSNNPRTCTIAKCKWEVFYQILDDLISNFYKSEYSVELPHPSKKQRI